MREVNYWVLQALSLFYLPTCDIEMLSKEHRDRQWIAAMHVYSQQKANI